MAARTTQRKPVVPQSPMGTVRLGPHPRYDATVVAPNYCCRKCGLRGTHVDVFEEICALPDASTISNAKRWQACEPRGGEFGTLRDAKRPGIQRERFSFEHRGRTVRICSPRVIRDRVVDESGRMMKGTVVGAAQASDVMREWGIAQFRRSRQVAPEIDVSLAWWYGFPNAPVRLFPAKYGSYSFGRQITNAHSRYGQRVINDLASRYQLTIREINQAFESAYPEMTISPRGHASAWKATVWVPFDMRWAIEPQVAVAETSLRQVRNDLLLLCGRKRMRREDRDLAWRDLHCFLLVSHGHLTAREAAEIVFPNEKGTAVRVRKIVQQVRTRIARNAVVSATLSGP